MDTPRILAISDVRMTAPPAAREGIRDFYVTFVGLEPLDGQEAPALVFLGRPRTGPRLIVSITDEHCEPLPRRQLLVQVANLAESAEDLLERAVPFAWSRGWTSFDRRLALQDPAGNWVELVAYHPF
ncbi:MAG: hypothetical protein GXY55_05545 [Phycisphaerae bacterium]|nr:hypothetical protein [Phycisphaerae bacterium]